MRKLVEGYVRTVAALFAFYFALSEVRADLFEQCSPCDDVLTAPCDLIDTNGCSKESLWNFGGWLEAGLYVNQYGQKNTYYDWAEKHGLNFPGNSELLNNVRQSDFQANQAWVFLEKKLDTRQDIDIGGRVDFVYGTDGRYTQSDGFEYEESYYNGWGEGDYYASFAQIYGEIGYKNLSVKIGKFLTPMGHDDMRAPERFFYSLSYAFAHLPDTHTGAIATWSPSKRFSLFGGWVNGENKTFSDNNDHAALFGAKLVLNPKIALTYSAMIGEDSYAEGIYPGFTHPDQEYFAQSLAVNVKPNSRWDYTFEWTLRNNKSKVLDYAMLPGYDYLCTNDTLSYFAPRPIDVVYRNQRRGSYGINNELIYRFNEKWAVGGRAEWMHEYWSEFGSYATDYSAYTLCLNWTPNRWLLVRPEIRYDKAFGLDKDRFDAIDYKDEQLSGGFSTVVQF